jgi:hypothetical protein
VCVLGVVSAAFDAAADRDAAVGGVGKCWGDETSFPEAVMIRCFLCDCQAVALLEATTTTTTWGCVGSVVGAARWRACGGTWAQMADFYLTGALEQWPHIYGVRGTGSIVLTPDRTTLSRWTT